MVEEMSSNFLRQVYLKSRIGMSNMFLTKNNKYRPSESTTSNPHIFSVVCNTQHFKLVELVGRKTLDKGNMQQDILGGMGEKGTSSKRAICRLEIRHGSKVRTHNQQ